MRSTGGEAIGAACEVPKAAAKTNVACVQILPIIVAICGPPSLQCWMKNQFSRLHGRNKISGNLVRCMRRLLFFPALLVGLIIGLAIGYVAYKITVVAPII
jgi:hypothetical protein